MRKLTLDVDSLVVQSFQTTTPDGGRGTVLGQGVVGPQRTPDCQSPLCILTEGYSCEGTCGDSCQETCYNSCQSCNSCIATCYQSCGGTCEASCGGTCPFCIPPTDPAFA